MVYQNRKKSVALENIYVFALWLVMFLLFNFLCQLFRHFVLQCCNVTSVMRKKEAGCLLLLIEIEGCFWQVFVLWCTYSVSK